MNQFQTDLENYLLSGHILLHVNTYEKERGIEQIAEVCKNNSKKIYVWNIANGWGNSNSEGSPEEAIKEVVSMEKDSVFILNNFHYYLNQQTYNKFDIVISLIECIKGSLYKDSKTIIFLSGEFQIPEVLRNDVTTINFPLPDEEHIKESINNVCKGITREGEPFNPNMDLLPEIINACRGMCSHQISDRTALAIRKNKDFNKEAVKTLYREKSNVIKLSGLLNYIEPKSGGLENIGGYEPLKRHILLDKPCFSKEAIEFGISPPKGLLLAGIPGCGKTVFCEAIASEFGLALLELSVENLMGGIVGESEKNTREAIKLIEAISPVVVKIDEVEKAFGGKGDLDGGTSKRLLGMFLKWLNDRKSQVYVVMTANDVSSLPPEFTRKGRIDEVYGMGLPNNEERKQIFNIHILNKKRDPINFDLDKLSLSCEGYTGADIQTSIEMGLKIAFRSKQELNDNFILTGLDSIKPLSKTQPEKIEELKKWIETRAKFANSQETTIKTPSRRNVKV